MNKLTKLLSVFIIAGAVGTGIAGAAGCRKTPSNTHPEHNYTYTDNGDGTHSATCDGCDSTITNQSHVDEDSNNVCDLCGGDVTEEEVPDHDHVFSEEYSYNATHHYKVCTVDGCDEHSEEGAHVLGEDKKCSVCGAQFKDALFEFEPSTLQATTYANGQKVGIFNILPGTTVRTRARENYTAYDVDGNEVVTGFTASKSVQYNGTDRGFGLYAPAPGKLTMYLDNGSSGLTEGQFQSIVLTKPDGTTQTLSYPAKKLRVLTVDLPAEGEYKITRGKDNGTTDVYYAKFEATVPETPIDHIQIADEGTVEYLLGQEFDKSRLQVQLVYSVTQMVEPLNINDANLKVDFSQFDSTQAGTYKITVTYTDGDGVEHNAEYNVFVYDVEALELGFNAIKTGSDGFNGTYENVALRQLYFVGDTIDLSGLTVKTVFNKGAKKNIVTEGYTLNVNDVDMSTPGKKEVVVSWANSATITAKFDIYVAAKPASVGETVNIKVDGATADAQIGVADNGVYQFRTIQQSLEFLKALELDENVKKVIQLAEGTYNEKVEVTIPNLTIKGSADATKTVIEWDALYGIEDESGFTHTTDSTATLNVRRAATGFVIEGVTISNWYNCTEHFDEAFGTGYNEHRALAALFQADKVVVDNCRLLGYQDTVEFFTGRQLVQNSFIQGRTDFIFGTNNTTYFYNCEIHSIVSGGYVTAFKGNNKDGNDAVTYGAIFDECQFTAPTSVVNAADTALGRPWGAYAAVAVINSSIAGHISDKAATGASAGTRYVTMSNNNPYDANVKFVEYNNTGDGAISEAVKGMRMLTADEAPNYSDLAVVFGTVNGGVTYTSEWDGSKGVEITEKTYRFSDYYTATDRFTYHETPEAGEEFFGELATVKGNWGHELNQSKDQGKFAVGTVIRFNVEGQVSVTTYGGDYGLPENIHINYIGGKAVITIVATEASPVKNGCYITAIVIDSAKEGVHVHEYGEWNVTAPTASATGTAVRTCVDCELETAASQSVTLPELSEDNYEIASGTTTGMSIYTYHHETYGDITFETDSLAGLHVHNYGDWVITADADNAGTATKTCTGGEGTCSEPTIVKNIPALSDEEYVITNNTATLEAGGTGTYTITVDGVEISFTAATPALTLTRITEDFTYTYNQNADLVSTDKILFTNCAKNGDWLKYGGNATITLNLSEGATLRFTRSTYEESAVVSINGVEQSVGNGGEVCYIATVAGYVTISASGTAYLKSISVEIDPNYQHKHTYGNWNVSAPTEEATGSANRTCLVEGCAEEGATQTVVLPVLSVENYAIAASENEGKSIYTYTHETYGEISFEADALAGVHVHNYGDWVINVSESGGTATKSCTEDCPDGDIVVNLPELTSDKYVITNNTATLEAAGTGTYTYTDETHGEISFTAATPQVEWLTVSAPETIKLTDCQTKFEGVKGVWNGIEIDATTGKFANNNSGWIQFNTGTVIRFKIDGDFDVNITTYQNADTASVVVADGYVTITATANGYISTVIISAKS